MSTLDPAGPGAEPITAIWWVMFWASVAIVTGVTALALYASFRRPERRVQVPTRLLVIGGGIVFPAVTVAALLVFGIRTGHSLLPLPTEEPVYRIDVTAHQWWWEVAYPDEDGRRLHSANEMHIPAGRLVDVHLRAVDVIHGFWIPRLGGKIDAIPGITNVIRLTANEPGIYRGQCAEFCGAQHARMALTLEAHTDSALEQRLATLAAAAPSPDEEPEGAAAFEAECARCHSVRAETRSPERGPNLADLSHRRFLGAGTIPNEQGALEPWLADHQRLKPGNRMPTHDHLDADTLASIVRYLEAIQ